jgi:predicted TIM-barrel fold metal-dependent hydrolase
MHDGMPIVDVHVHIHPQCASHMARAIDAAGVSRIVSLGILESLDIPFAEGMRAYRAALGDRLVYFTTPDFRDVAPGFGARMADDLSRKIEGGARGLKIFKELGLRHRDAAGELIAVDDARLDPLWARAGALGAPVLIHSADPVAFFQPLDEHNERREELALRPDWHFYGPEFPTHAALMAQLNHIVERHPATTFIGAHVGSNAEDLGYVSACLDRYPNYTIDTCARVGEIGRHPANEVRAFFLKYQDRILFGTDTVLGWDGPRALSVEDMADLEQSYEQHWRFFETNDRQIEYPGYPVQGNWKVDAIGLPQAVLEKLYYRNAQRLIPGL